MFCRGLFKLVDEDELFSVTCRGVRLTQEQRDAGVRNPATTRLGESQVDDQGHDASEDFRAGNVEEAKRILDLATNDPVAAINAVEAWSEPTRQMVFSNYTPLRTWVENYYKSGGAASSEAVMEARRALEALGEDSFADHVDKYDQKQRDMVRGDRELNAAYMRSFEKRKVERDRLTRERLGLIEKQKTIRQEAEAQIDSLQKLAAEMGVAITNLTGTPNDHDAVASLSTAFGSLMGFVQTTQAIGEKEALKTVIGRAAAVHHEGADLGVALATYSEIQDNDNLTKLKAAMEKVLQSAASLTGTVPTDLPDPPPLDFALTS
jgi:hypothetical protein